MCNSHKFFIADIRADVVTVEYSQSSVQFRIFLRWPLGKNREKLDASVKRET